MKIETTHLAYHICPIGTFSWNVKELSKYVKSFNGLKVIGLAHISTIPLRPVIAEIQDALGKDVIIKKVQNDPLLRECATFKNIFNELELKISDKEHSAIWYGHTKGVTHTKKRSVQDVTMLWAKLAYYECLNRHSGPLQEHVDALSKGFPFSGPFKRYGLYPNMPGKPKWHYSGTFYWMRADKFFESNWRSIFKMHRYMVEALPGLLVHERNGYCNFMEACSDLYKLKTWQTELGSLNVQNMLRELNTELEMEETFELMQNSKNDTLKNQIVERVRTKRQN